MSEASPTLICPLCQATYHDASLEYCHQDGARLRPRAAMSSRSMGQILGERYEILRFLGAGGMAEVYQARQLADGQEVAIKLMRPQMSDDPALVERFKLEARMIGLIDHPNVVSLLDFGTLEDRSLFMAMELLHGESLEDLLGRGPVGQQLALEIAVQACAGIQAAHDKGIIHRDIKPANIFLKRQEDADRSAEVLVKILDLGIAKLSDNRLSNLTATGMIFGSPEYISPEQAQGKKIDARADIYAFGVVLFHIFTGSVPFMSDSFIGILTKQVTTAPKWPAELARQRGLPEGLEAVILKTLAKSPDHRYQTIQELREALTMAFNGHRFIQRPAASPSARPTDMESRARTRIIRRVTLSQSGADLDNEVVEIAPDIFWVGRREGVLLERNIYLRVYRGNGLQLNVLIDPGPTRDLSSVAAKIRPIIGSLEKIDIIFLNHQDPDVAGNAAVIQELNQQAHVICSEDTWRLVYFYGLRPKGYSATEHFRGMRMTLATGHVVSFIPSPYCHFRGAVMYYDQAARVLFSGDLFSGLSRSLELVAGEEAVAGIEIFHQIYMPSRRALGKAVDRIRQLDPPPLTIAPQHGGILGGEQIERILARVAELEVGVDLFDAVTMDRCLVVLNEIVEGLVQLVGGEQIAKELRRFSTDGTFPNLFLFGGEHRITEVKIEPRAALRTLIEHARTFLPQEKQQEFEARVAKVLSENDLQPFPPIAALEDPEPYLELAVE